jgi:GNAT superfamily N-acetyltransferase
MTHKTALTFRDATVNDLPAIVAMLADDQLGKAREDSSLPLDKGYINAFDAITRDENQRLIVVSKGAMLVGTMQLSFLPGLSSKGAWRGQLEAVRVASARRSEGIGAVMIDWAVLRCREKGCKSVQLTTNKSRKDAHRFYEKLGFVQSHEGYKLSL